MGHPLIRSLQANAADYFLHVDAVATVHPRGDESVSGPGVAGVIAHPVVAPVRVWVGEFLCELGIGEGYAAVGGDRGESLVVDIGRVIAPV